MILLLRIDVNYQAFPEASFYQMQQMLLALTPIFFVSFLSLFVPFFKVNLDPTLKICQFLNLCLMQSFDKL